jgi:hypothetical protein
MLHTLGPWRIYDGGADAEAVHVMANGAANEETTTICERIDNPADATLIAAAPELLAALRALLACAELNLDDMDPATLAAIDVADAAIAKAEGAQ